MVLYILWQSLVETIVVLLNVMILSEGGFPGYFVDEVVYYWVGRSVCVLLLGCRLLLFVAHIVYRLGLD